MIALIDKHCINVIDDNLSDYRQYWCLPFIYGCAFCMQITNECRHSLYLEVCNVLFCCYTWKHCHIKGVICDPLESLQLKKDINSIGAVIQSFYKVFAADITANVLCALVFIVESIFYVSYLKILFSKVKILLAPVKFTNVYEILRVEV